MFDNNNNTYSQQGNQLNEPLVPNNQNNNQNNMASPFMPNSTTVGLYTQYQTFQNQKHYKQTLQYNGYQKLQEMKYIYFRSTGKTGCSDTKICAPFNSEVTLKFDKQAYENVMQIKFNKQTCCSSNIDGKVISFNYDQQGIPREEEVFDIKYTRNCFFLKCTLCTILPVLAPYCFISACGYNGHQVLQTKAGQKVSEIQYGCICSPKKGNINIENNQQQYQVVECQGVHTGNQKFKIYKVKSQQDQNFQVNITVEHMLVSIDKHGNKHFIPSWFYIKFPEDMSPEQKITLILFASQIK